jgi:hypothetical protein
MWEAMNCRRKLSGGGGTDFRPVFEWVDEANIQPGFAGLFHRRRRSVSRARAGFPVVWLVKGKAARRLDTNTIELMSNDFRHAGCLACIDQVNSYLPVTNKLFSCQCSRRPNRPFVWGPLGRKYQA